MSLLYSDYMLSVHSFDETWQLVAKAIQESSSEQFQWHVEEDRDGHRITATMEYKKPLRLKRCLLLEVNFLRTTDDKIRLELNYDISPMFNIGEPEGILRKAKNAIALAVTSDGQVYSSQHALPAELSDAEATVKGEKGIMRGVEIVLVLAIIVLILQAMMNPSWDLVGLLWFLGLLAIPAGFCALLYGMYVLIRGTKESQKDRQRTVAQKTVTGVLAVLGGIALCIVALPVILVGLCVGALTWGH